MVKVRSDFINVFFTALSVAFYCIKHVGFVTVCLQHIVDITCYTPCAAHAVYRIYLYYFHVIPRF